MRNVNTFTYKKLIPIFTMMISTKAFALEGDFYFGDPFKEHLYKEGLDLAGLPNGKYYKKILWNSEVIDRFDSIVYKTIYQVNNNAKLPHEDDIDPSDPDTISISGKAWDIVWGELGDFLEEGDYREPGDTRPVRYNQEQFVELGVWHKPTFLYIDCMDYGVKHVEISDIHVKHNINDAWLNGGVLRPTDHPIPAKTLSIHNCESVSIKNSTFKGPVSGTHIAIDNCNHILIDSIDISGTIDSYELPNNIVSYLGSGIGIGGGNKNEILERRDWRDGSPVTSGTSSTIIKNSYIHDYTGVSNYVSGYDPNDPINNPGAIPNHDAVAIRSPGTGIFFNNVFENYSVFDEFGV